MKMFNMTECKAYPHEKLNISKVVRSGELDLTTVEEDNSSSVKTRSYRHQKNYNQKGQRENPDEHVYPDF